MIHIHTKTNLDIPIDSLHLKQAVLQTLQATGTPLEYDLTMVLSDDRKLRQLNRDFSGIDAPTDVLSFPADYTDPDSQQKYLGDIIISVPRAAAQAEENNASLKSELILLAVHGTLHLLGYDHATADEKERMWAIQNLIMEKLT